MGKQQGAILTCVDFSDVGDAVVAMSERMAKAFGYSLCLLHVCIPEPEFVTYEPGPEYIRNDAAEHYRQAHRKIQEIEKQLTQRGLAVEALVVQGNPVKKIIEKAEHLSAEMIVMGSHGHGALYKLLVGSVAEGVLRKSRLPVVIVPAEH